MTYFTLFPTALGQCGIAWRGDMIVATHLPEDDPAETARILAARTGAIEGEPPAAIRHAIEAMTALLDGEKTDLTSFSCDFSDIETFAADVYRAARAIPAGETLTYGEIASQLGNKQLSRNVGQALGQNPFPIVVPCHRVVGAGGKLIGFSAAGGVITKLKMLEIEGAHPGGTPSLFDDLPIATKPTNRL